MKPVGSKALFFSALLALACLIPGCSGGWEVPSPGSERQAIFNATSVQMQIFGHAVDSKGEAASGGIAKLIPTEYHPPLPYDTFAPVSPFSILVDTVQDGIFEFSGVGSGAYNLEVIDWNGTKVFKTGIFIDPSATIFPLCTLHATGSAEGITGNSYGPAPESTFVYLLGTDYCTYVLGYAGRFSMRELPPGNFKLGLNYPPRKYEAGISAIDSATSPLFRLDLMEFPYNSTVSAGEISITSGDTTRMIINTPGKQKRSPP